MDKTSCAGGVILKKDNAYLLISNEDYNNGELRDYKFFCFNGKPRFLKVDFNRFTEHRANYYDTEGKVLPFGEAMCPPEPERKINLPCELTKMISCAERLSRNIPFVRVDFYYTNQRIYFGEMTFFPASGFGVFEPPEWDDKIGGMLDINQK